MMEDIQKIFKRVVKVLGFRIVNVRKKYWVLRTFWSCRWRDNDHDWQEKKVHVLVHFNNDCNGRMFLSVEELLKAFLKAKTLWWKTGPFTEKIIDNPFFNTVFSKEALEIKLDLIGT